jgi:hypothetical protein
MNFVEDRSGPPSRAYLKLWEALTRLGRYPKPGESCIDLGASPGGWTWVIQSLGAHVIAVDKAPLDPAVVALTNVEVREQSAFALTPDEIGPVDWLFSDIICYPERLLRLVDDLRADLGAPGLPFLACTIGELRPDAEGRRVAEMNRLLLSLPQKRAGTACVDARDLVTHIGDQVHFDTAAQEEIGRRYAAAYLALAGAG